MAAPRRRPDTVAMTTSANKAGTGMRHAGRSAGHIQLVPAAAGDHPTRGESRSPSLGKTCMLIEIPIKAQYRLKKTQSTRIGYRILLMEHFHILKYSQVPFIA